ncbi:MAG: U32 family peptidase, partial [Nitrospirota bacterium]|nr:U32 family peptidase [Nitrospirota bacterium]
QTSMKTEVFAYGRLPLAFSWRCYTSRNFGKLRSQCTQDCMNFSDGIALETLDHKPIFTINGTQIMSNQVYSLAEEVEDLRRMGMSTLRLSPHSWQMKDVIAIHAALVNGTMTGRSARAELEKITGAPLCNGWFYGRAGWERVDRDAPDALKILGIENVSVS